MNQVVAKVLSHGGVEVPASEKVDYMAILESWIGLPNAKEWETEMMEDSAPFVRELYQSLAELLVVVWKPTEEVSMLHSNVFLEMDCDPKEMSLYKTMESVRTTRLLRYWMDLNVQGGHTMVDEADKTLSHYLLEQTSTSTQPSSTAKPQNPLIQALYHHIRQLPQLQAQINFYSQALMRGDRQTPSGKALSNPQSRLAHYQEAQHVSSKLNQEWDDHLEAMEFIVGDLYSKGNADIRRECRSLLGSVWSQFVTRAGGGGGGVQMENTSASGIQMTLRVLHRILLGTCGVFQKSHEHLLTYHLVPLHRPTAMVLWRDQTSLLELYHEPLVQCIATLLQKKPGWIPKVIAGLLEPEIWTKGGNTPKLVLLLHEIDTYIGIIPDPSKHPLPLDAVLPNLLRALGVCMASDHSGLAERALSFMKNNRFQTLIELNYDQALSILLPFLVRSEPAWNPTVRKMTWTVLKKFQDFDEEKFLRISNKCFPSTIPETTTILPRSVNQGSAKKESKETHVAPLKDFTLKSAMGGWKPPGATGSRHHPGMPPPPGRAARGRGAPPLAANGVAPWTTSRPQKPLPSSKNPPLGVTGVAPWAMKTTPPAHAKRRAGEALSGVAEENAVEEKRQTVDCSSAKDHLPRVLAYMEEIKPAEEEEGGSSWSKAQMAETPTLLPNLKFHDLVFGHDLGEGAFGSVRYARLIDRNRTRSQWPEYAVKVVSTEKIKEMGYEACVQREVAVLRVLPHPGITRLVSSFRFREGVYLVLEYANGGDLHSLLRRNGSIDHESTRFVIGEVIAALASLHEIGLVYADLKPENIVITESGHLKLTDFGGSRPVTPEAKKLIESSAKNLLKGLRDGDWKPKTKKIGFPITVEAEDDVDKNLDPMEIDHDDMRIEGTTAYLPPEVVMGGFPTFSADSWALGCVLYQCLTGRPPILEADDAQTRSRIVSFNASGPAQDDEAQLFGDSHATHITKEARDLITSLLNRHPVERPSMTQAAQHDFFHQAGMDVFSLHRKQALPLDVGDVSPVADAQWSRRQFSSIWAPQPQAYDISLVVDNSNHHRGDAPSGPIPEGDEATSFFSKVGALSSGMGDATSKIPLPTATRTIEEN
jgi:serine/threonine protein kinase